MERISNCRYIRSPKSLDEVEEKRPRKDTSMAWDVMSKRALRSHDRKLSFPLASEVK